MRAKSSHIVFVRLELTTLLSLHLQLLLVRCVGKPDADGVIVLADGFVVVFLDDLMAFFGCLEAVLIVSDRSRLWETGTPTVQIRHLD